MHYVGCPRWFDSNIVRCKTINNYSSTHTVTTRLASFAFKETASVEFVKSKVRYSMVCLSPRDSFQSTKMLPSQHSLTVHNCVVRSSLPETP